MHLESIRNIESSCCVENGCENVYFMTITYLFVCYQNGFNLTVVVGPVSCSEIYILDPYTFSEYKANCIESKFWAMALYPLHYMLRKILNIWAKRGQRSYYKSSPQNWRIIFYRRLLLVMLLCHHIKLKSKIKRWRKVLFDKKLIRYFKRSDEKLFHIQVPNKTSSTFPT